MTISVRIICMDHYMATPGPFDRSYSPFSTRKLSKVPVVRIFGSTLAGQKVCLHVHQVYPYFFIPYTIPKEVTTEQEIQKNIFQFGTSLNEAMNIAKPNAEKDQHIVAIALTKGVPFYGYHVGYQSYLKIYLTNPYEKQQMAELLQSEAILGIRFQPYEAHLNFELQFLMDHNLYGMDWLHIDEEQPLYPPLFRLPISEETKSSYSLYQSSSTIDHSNDNINQSNNSDNPIKLYPIYTSRTIPPKQQSDLLPRNSYCELELDITGMSIMNRLDLKERDIHASLQQEKSTQKDALYNAEEEAKKKLIKSLESIWKEETSRRKSRGIFDPIPPVSQFEERDPHVPWIVEPASRKLMQKMITKRDVDNAGDTVESSSLMPDVMTIFEANEALYPEEYQVWKRQHQDIKTKINRINDENVKTVATNPSSSGLSGESKLPSISENYSYRSTTPPLTSTQQKSAQFNIIATPTRYRAWDISTQLDKSIIDSLIRDPSFQKDREDEDEEEQEDDDTKNTSEVDDDEYFSQVDHITSSSISKWIEETDQVFERFPTTAIEYSEDPPVPYRPRKLDFIAESQRIDNILLQEEQKGKTKKHIFNDIMEWGNVDFTEEDKIALGNNNTKEHNRKSDVVEENPINISDMPPDPTPWSHKNRKIKRRIKQLDGANDEKNDELRRAKRQKSAAERWDMEMKTLKKMRKPKLKRSNTVMGEKKRMTELIDEQDDSNMNITVDERRVENSSVLQVKSVNASKSKIHTIRTSSSLPILSLNDLPDNAIDPKNTAANVNTIVNTKQKPSNSVILRDKKLVYPPKELSNNSNAVFDSDTLQIAVGDVGEHSTDTDRYHVLKANTSSKAEILNEAINSSFFQNSPRSGSSNDRTVSTQQRGNIPTENRSRLLRKINDDASVHVEYDWPSILPHSQLQLANESQSIMKELIFNHKSPLLSQKEVPNKRVVYKEPYYSKESDLPRYPTVFAGKEFRLPTSGISSVKEFESSYSCKLAKKESLRNFTRIKVWTPICKPPSWENVIRWAKINNVQKRQRIKSSVTQLDEPTVDNSYAFKISASKPQAKVRHIRDYIDYFSLEIHANTRGRLLPDPQHDPVQLIFWCLQTEDQHVASNGYQEGYQVGVIALNHCDINKIGLSNLRAVIDYADSEEQLFTMLIAKIRYYDPDMLAGYEVQNASWGYLVERGIELGIHLLDELSRVIVTSDNIKKDQWGSHQTSAYKVYGRHMLNIWRLMKGEIALTSYTFENIAFHLLRNRLPHYSYETLTKWYTKGPAVLKYRLFKYYLKRVQMNLDILAASQVITRTCESARVFGIDFYSVLSRGSQYKVESIMFRIAKPENYVLITPNRKQVASQRSLECLPLIMEPISQFYNSPMVVLDFQSLYPSIMIAYNYCYSTCLGRVRNLKESSRFGVQADFDLPDGLLDDLKDYINVSPNGVMFVKPEIRKSLLAKMLAELLDTRVMIKRAMRDYKEDSGLLRMLDAKQLTLKLLANVTYGYTSASFSGRMPSVEIADSIVSTGRETLERTIRLINETEKWGARVVYGDTDSVFIYFPGKTKSEAFTLGNEIAETATKMNPSPVKLKFEKVYHPAVLLAKKRYVGFKYENQDDVEPTFEAKGIETVRRDGTAATQKILESCLKILFRTQDMSELKNFLYRQWTKILSNRVLLQEFIISKEVKMGSYSSRGGPNGAQIAQAQMNGDSRAEPQYGERVPYVVVYRGPKARLKDKVVRPQEFLADHDLRLDAEYYIRKQIVPPLSRVFNLMGVDIEAWYESMPRVQKANALAIAQANQPQNKRVTRIDQYYVNSHCIVCREVTDQVICNQCQQVPSETIFSLTTRQQQAQHKFRKILQTCQDCSKLSALDATTYLSEENNEQDEFADIPCDSLDCPILYERYKAKEDVRVTLSYNSILDNIPF